MFSLPELPQRNIETLAARAWARRLYPALGVTDPIAEGLWAALGAPRVKASPGLRTLCEAEAELEERVHGFWARKPRAGLLELGAGLSTRLPSLALGRGRANLVAVDSPENSRLRAWLFATDTVAERAFPSPSGFPTPKGEFLVLIPKALEPWHGQFLREVLPRFESVTTFPEQPRELTRST